MNERISTWFKSRSRRPARGFSLIELVVVIAIIMALAGILTLTLPDLLSSANQSSMYTNIKLCDDMIQSWASVNGGKYPTGWDSLINGSGALYAFLPTNATNGIVGNCLSALTLNDAYVLRLKRAGITTVCDMTNYNGSSTNAVNASYMAGNFTSPRAIAAGGTLAQVNVSALPTDRIQMEFSSNNTYVVFGVGKGTQKLNDNGTLAQRFVGAGGYIKDQPICVHDDGCTSPKSVYCVPCAIFDLGATTSAAPTGRDTTVARYLGTVAVGASGFIYSDSVINKLGQ
jgi:prepilin-type N-terminal cleavage/methylation domain-containing protein